MTQSTQPILVPVVNGLVKSIANVRANIAGMDFSGGFIELKYDLNTDYEDVLSNNTDPVGHALGPTKYAGSAKILVDWLRSVIANVGPGYAALPFSVYVGYVSDLSTGQAVASDQLIGCKFGALAISMAAGSAKAISVDVNLRPLKILLGGVDNNPAPLASPQS